MVPAEFSPDAKAHPESGIFGLDTPFAQARLVLLPVPLDATTSYGQGAAKGPKAMLRASHQVDLFDRDTGRPYEAGLHLLPEDPSLVTLAQTADEAAAILRKEGASDDKILFDALMRVNATTEHIHAWVQEEAERLLDAGKIVGVLGGDHSTPFGLIAALAKRHADLGILHLDAHADLRHAYDGLTWSHASIMDNVLNKTSVKKLVQVGVRDFCEGEYDAIREAQGRIVTFFDQDLAFELHHGATFAQLTARIVAELPQEVYISFDIDGLDPSLCPHTGTPVPGGLSFREMNMLLKTLLHSGRRIVGFDLSEVAPGDDEWDANVGARVLYKLCGYTLQSQAGT